MLARNRLNTTRAILEMRSTIEIQKTPRSGPGQFLTLTGYSNVLLKITRNQVIYVLIHITLTKIIRILIVFVLSVVAWFDNTNLVSAHVVKDQTLKVMDFFICNETVVYENTINE